MKKIILCAMSLLFAIGAFAQTQEFGVVVGGLNGLSYKKIMSENFAIQTDLAVGFQSTTALEEFTYIRGRIDIFDFTLNPNFLYNKELSHGLYAFAGGGVNLGLAQDLPNGFITFGKFGLNAMLGAGYKMDNVPLSFSLDFRPGYALLLNYYYETVWHIFDWHLAASVRYCF